MNQELEASAATAVAFGPPMPTAKKHQEQRRMVTRNHVRVLVHALDFKAFLPNQAEPWHGASDHVSHACAALVANWMC